MIHYPNLPAASANAKCHPDRPTDRPTDRPLHVPSSSLLFPHSQLSTPPHPLAVLDSHRAVFDILPELRKPATPPPPPPPRKRYRTRARGPRGRPRPRWKRPANVLRQHQKGTQFKQTFFRRRIEAKHRNRFRIPLSKAEATDVVRGRVTSCFVVSVCRPPHTDCSESQTPSWPLYRRYKTRAAITSALLVESRKKDQA